MKLRIIFSTLFCFFIFGESLVLAQMKQIDQVPSDGTLIQLKPKAFPGVTPMDADKLIPLDFSSFTKEDLKNMETRIYPTSRNEDGIPIFFKGSLKAQKGKSINDQISIYLAHINQYYNLTNIELEYQIQRIDTDELGMEHIEIQQVFKGIPIEGSIIKLHTKDGIIAIASGHFLATPKINTVPSIEISEAIDVVTKEYQKQGIHRGITTAQKKLMPEETEKVDLVILKHNNTYRLAYRVDSYANMIQRFVYFIDAQDGSIIHNYKNYCSLHNHNHNHSNNDVQIMPPPGPEIATAQDLKNINRTINTYEEGGTFYMLDASRDMYNAGASSMPDEPVGVIWTIDAFNTNPQNNDFSYDHVTSSNNSWNNKTAVSAHYNGGIAFEYFKGTHNRNSINGEGGNIVSLINISDPETGGGFDNAFWNGAAMFYGNGNTAFDPLAEALDVAGHEMSHGVVQATANLTYQGESGAMNEAFADIFGAMMDREDWFIGEEIAKTSAFPTGRMRDMSNPHNGGNSLSDPGWQPDNTNEQYTGSQDNGGVHINSGIINHAYYKYAETANIGKDKAELVFYRALTVYLSKSSNFKDCRAAVEQAAEDLYSSIEKDAASQAFADVGIGEGGGTTDYETEVEMNPGADFLLTSDSNLSNLLLRNNSLDLIAEPLSDIDHRSKPSATDNGQFIFFVGQDNNIYYLTIDWDTNQVGVTTFDDQGIWRNVIISKDGSRLAALTNQTNNEILVYDFDLMGQEIYEFYNPTFSEGVSTGDVDFADAMEFDFTGEWIMYDAQSTITGTSGNIVYWDIGFINVFNNSSNSFADGTIQKLFSQLPENTSVGNPTFSKNSPHIIAFDIIEGQEYKVIGANIETNVISEIFENGGLGFPNFNTSDQQIVYQLEWIFGIDIGLTELEDDKITPKFDSDGIIVETNRLPVIFSNGERDIVSTENEELQLLVDVFPNPTIEKVQVSWKIELNVESLSIYNATGSLIKQSNVVNKNQFTAKTIDWSKGTYHVVLKTDQGDIVKTIIKQ